MLEASAGSRTGVVGRGTGVSFAARTMVRRSLRAGGEEDAILVRLDIETRRRCGGGLG